MVNSANRSLSGMCLTSTGVNSCSRSDSLSVGDRDLIRAARRDVRGHEPACLVVVNVECDVTLIRVQAARGGGRKLL